MNWKGIASKIGQFAPIAGTLIGGPAGGTIGSMVASALGVEPTPDAVAKALDTDPQAAIKLRELELNHQVEMRKLAVEAAATEMQQETLRLGQINETMRAELQSDSWPKSGWRPFIGWVFGLAIGGLFFSMITAIFRQPTILTNAEFTGMLVWLFTGTALVLGVNIQQRSKDKQVKGGLVPAAGMAEGLVNKLTKS